jgi:hypothetical protein
VVVDLDPLDGVAEVQNDSQSFVINPPVFTSDPVTASTATEEIPYSDTIAGSATDPDNDPLFYSKTSGPAWLSVAGDGALSGTPAASDVGANVFTILVADGNGGTDAATLHITVNPAPPTWIEILSDDFESGMGNWTDGGSDCRHYTGTHSPGGNGSVELRDNSGAASSMTTGNLPLSGKTEIEVVFSYKPRSMDRVTEDFWLLISTDGGGSYSQVEEWNRDDEFVNDQVYLGETLAITGYALTDQTRLRFQCDASGNKDWVYIDDVTISAQ